MDLHNGLDVEVYDLRPTDLHYIYTTTTSDQKITYHGAGLCEYHPGKWVT